MKQISLFVLLLGVLLAPFAYAPPTYAKESDYSEEMLNEPILLDIANYLFSEVERPGFDRVTFVTGFLLYANKVDLSDTSCSVLASARLLSWAIEVYRIEGNYAMKVIDEDEYERSIIALFTSRAKVYEVYCGLYPIACIDGKPMEYDDFLSSIEPSSTNEPL